MKNFQKAVSAILTSVIVLGCGSALHADTGVVDIDKYNFPDKNFREYVYYAFDKNTDHSLDANEIAQIKTISDCDMYASEGLTAATSLKGIEYFTSLETLEFTDDCNLDELDLTNTNIKNVKLVDIPMKTIRIGSSVENLEITWAINLRTLDFSKATNLKNLILDQDYYFSKVESDKLKVLDLSACGKLESLKLSFFPCKEIRFSNQITKLTMNTESIKTKYIDFSECKNLTYLDLGFATIKSVDLPSQLFSICNSTYKVSSERGADTYKGNGCTLIF